MLPTPKIEPDLSNWIEIGTVVAPQGLNGEVRVYPDTDFPERFERPGQRWILKPNASEPESIKLLKGYLLPGKGLFVVKFAGVSDRNQAEAIRNSKVLVPISDRPRLQPGEFHLMDLIGLKVILKETQETIGRVVSVMSAGNDLLEVELLPDPEQEAESDAENPKVLIPFVDEIVPIVNLEAQCVEIVPPIGLLDLR
jgi:16S rRNA processing protein RimM